MALVVSIVAFLVCHIPCGGGGINSPLSASPGLASFGLTIAKLSFWPRCIVSPVHLSPLPSCPPSSALLQFYFWHRHADADVSSVPNFVATAKLHASRCSIPKTLLPRLPVPFYRRLCLLLSALLQLPLHPFEILLLFVANCE